jgi:hypothetical protein
MSIRILAFILVCTATFYGQRHRFSWQEACFKNPAAPYCPGHDFAIKPEPKNPAARNVVTNPFPGMPRESDASVIAVSGIDWRFADPAPDVLAGFNFAGLSSSPIARGLIAQLGASQGLAETDVRQIFERLSSVDQVAFSVRGNQIVAMVSCATDTILPPVQNGWKTAPVNANALLVGDAAAVDEAVQRIGTKGAVTELASWAGERQTRSEFWAVGPAGYVGPQALSAGVKRFSLAIFLRDRPFSDAAFEFEGVPAPNTLQMWPALGEGTIEGRTVHVRMPIESDEALQQFGQIAASPLGQHVGALLPVARNLPMRDTTVPKRTKPVIYGLDGGPKEVH